MDATSALAARRRHVPRRVLVVDDNTDAADTLSLLLQLFGHQTATAYTGRAALEIAPTFAPEAAFVSIRLPGGMDGYELARRFRGSSPAAGSPRILVALTGMGTPADLARATEAGFDHHFIKPADPNALAGLLDAMPGTPNVP